MADDLAARPGRPGDPWRRAARRADTPLALADEAAITPIFPDAGRSMRSPEAEQRLRLESGFFLALMERRVIVPIKWLTLLLTWLYWYARQEIPGPPEPTVFGIFAFYFMANIGHAYLCHVGGINVGQARPFSLISLLVDVGFILGLLTADAMLHSTAPDTLPHPFDPTRVERAALFRQDFVVFFCLIVIRGLAILRGAKENLTFGLLVTAAMIGLSRMLEGEFDFSFGFRLAILWLVFSIGWYLIEAIHRQQDQIFAMRERLVRTESLATLGEVSAGVAHEINNPIAIIGTCADYLKNSIPKSSRDLVEEVDTIRDEARRCKRIVQDLLDFASPEQSREIADIDLRQLVDGLIEQLITRTWGDKTPTIERFYAPTVYCVRGDPHKLVQAFKNILVNAQHYMGPGGTLTVRIEPREHEGTRMLEVMMSDTGPGIPAPFLAHIFTPFFTRRKGGTGLGLAITKRIVQAHGGWIDAQSSLPTPGTTMTIRLPTIDQPAPDYFPLDLDKALPSGSLKNAPPPTPLPFAVTPPRHI